MLLVEDDPALVALLHELLNEEGFDVVDAPDGNAALLELESRPDVILLDIRMPVVDGAAFLRTYRSTPDPRAPVICMTSFEVPADLPMDDVSAVLEKPFGLAAVVAAIDRALEQQAA